MTKIYRALIILVCILGLCVPLETAFGKIRDRGQKVPEEMLQEIFNAYLNRELRKDSSDIVVSRFKVNGNRQVPAGKVRFQLFQKDRRKLIGHVRLVAVILVDEKVKNEVQLSGWVDIFEQVVCVNRNLRRGELIAEEDLYLVRQNISRMSSGIIVDPDRIVGMKAKQGLKADSLVKRWMLEKPAVVNRGDAVTILAESLGMRVSVPGRVLEKGYKDKLVKVQNAMSKKVLYGKVVNNLIVKVAF